MPQVISLSTLKDIDLGKIDVAVQHHLRRVVDDCMDRAANDTARTVTLKFIITPQTDDYGNCEACNLEFDIGSNIPNHRSRPINCGVRKSRDGGQLLFNPLLPSDAGSDLLGVETINGRPIEHEKSTDADASVAGQ